MRTDETSTSPGWVALEVTLPDDADATEDLLSGVLPELGAVGLEYLGDPRRIRATFHTARSPEALVEHVHGALEGLRLGHLALAAAPVQDDDWRPFWDQAFEPLRFGPLAIVPSWHPAPEDTLPLVIDPSGAFGTGLHPTTTMVLDLLVAHPPTGPVLDVGTGTGVLALAALRLGAPRVVGLDIAAEAVEAARRAAEANGLSDRFEVHHAELETIEETFPRVLANLRPAPLTELAAHLASRVATDGELIVSGVRSYERADVIATLRGVGLDVHEGRMRDDWVALCLRPR